MKTFLVLNGDQIGFNNNVIKTNINIINNNNFTLSIKSSFYNIKSIELFTLNGQSILIKNIINKKTIIIDISNIPKGLYLLKTISMVNEIRVNSVIIQ